MGENIHKPGWFRRWDSLRKLSSFCMRWIAERVQSPSCDNAPSISSRSMFLYSGIAHRSN